MIFEANKNLEKTSKNIIVNLSNKIFVGTIILLAILLNVFLRVTGIFFYIDFAITLLVSFFLYVPLSVKIITSVQNIINYTELDDNFIIMRSNDLKLFWGVFKLMHQEIQISLNDENINFSVENNFQILNYNTEAFSFLYKGNKYYLVEAFFDDFEILKNRLGLK